MSDNASSSDTALVDNMARFLRASMKGWAWVRENSDAADIVLENEKTGAQTENHQRRMMGEINKLTAGGGKLDEAISLVQSALRNRPQDGKLWHM